MARELEMTFSLGAKLASSFNTAFSAAGSYMSQFAKRTENFAKTAGNIKTFEAVQKKLEGHQKALADYQKRLKSIQFSGNTAEIEQLNSKIAESQNVISREASQLDTLRSSLQGAGVDMKNLTSEHARFSAAAERSAKTQADYQKAVAQLDKDKKALSLSSITSGVMSAGAYLAPLGAGVKQAMGFEKAMAKVRAISNFDDSQFANLTTFVEDWAGKTVYGPEETAKVAENLARAGYGIDEKTGKNQIMDLLPSILKGAAANDISTDQMSSMLADTMGAYGFKADKAQYVMDAMMTAAKQSNQSIADVYENIKQAGPVLKNVGASFEQAMAYTNVLSAQGIKGSEAGNMIKRIFGRETKDVVQKELAKIGVGYKDANGNTRTLESLMKDIGQKTKNMGNADRQAILAKIFGQEAVTGASGLIESAMNGDFEKYLTGLQNSKGSTDEAYRIMTDNLMGDLGQLGNAFTNLKMAIGKPLIDPFRDFVQGATAAVQAIADFTKEHPILVKGIGAIATAMAAVSAGSVLMKAGIAAIRFPFDQINVWVKYLKMVGNGSALAAIKTKVLTAAQWVVAGASKAWAAAQGVLNAVMNACPIFLLVTGIAAAVAAVYALWKNWDKIDEYLSQFELWQKFKNVASAAWEGVKNACSAAWDGICAAFSNPGVILDWISNLGSWILNGLTSALAAVGSGLADLGGWIWDGLVSSWDSTVDWFSANGPAIWDGLVTGWEATKTALSDGWTAITEYASAFGEWLTKNGVPLWDGIKSGWETTKTALADGWNVITGYATEFGNWIVANGGSLWTGLVSGWESTKTALSEGWDAVNGYVTNFSNWMAANGPVIWDGIVTGWNEASKLLSEGWSALEGVVTKFGEWLSNIGSTIWNGLTAGWDAAKGVLEEGLNWVGSAWDKTASFAGDMWDGIKSFMGFESTGNEIIDQKALAQQLSDITVLDKMSKTFADRVAAMTNEWQPFKQSLAEGFENIFSVMTQLVTKITGEFVPAIQQASQSFRDMQTAVSAVATAANGGSQAAPKAPGSSYLFGGAMAKGGILNGPQIILAGEAGAEAVIPLTNDRYGLPLLQQAASAFGLDVVSPEHSFSDLSGLASAGSSTTTNTINSEPVINIPIQVDGGLQLEDLATKIRDLVADFIRTSQEDQLRGAFV